MYCTDGKYIGLIGALAFLGSAIACAILPILGDKIGRYPVFIITQALQIPMFLAAIYTTSLGLVYFVVFFLGFCLIGRFTCGFVLFVELLPEAYKAISGSAILIGYSISVLEVTAYYAFISPNSLPTIWVGFVLTAITFCANFILPESPQWLVSQGHFDKARASLMTIAKWNGVHVDKFEPFVEEIIHLMPNTDQDEGEDGPKKISEVEQEEKNA
jgi:MFS family permease